MCQVRSSESVAKVPGRRYPPALSPARPTYVLNVPLYRDGPQLGLFVAEKYVRRAGEAVNVSFGSIRHYTPDFFCFLARLSAKRPSSLIVSTGDPIDVRITARRPSQDVELHASRAAMPWVLSLIDALWCLPCEDEDPVPAGRPAAGTARHTSRRAAVYLTLPREGQTSDICKRSVAAAHADGATDVTLFADAEMSPEYNSTPSMWSLRKRLGNREFSDAYFADGRTPSVSLTMDRIVLRRHALRGVAWHAGDENRWWPLHELALHLPNVPHSERETAQDRRWRRLCAERPACCPPNRYGETR